LAREPLGQSRLAPELDHSVGDIVGPFAHEQVDAVADIDPFGRLGSSDDGTASREGLEQLQPRSAAVPQGNDDGVGQVEIRPDVGHASSQRETGIAAGLHGRARRRPDQQQPDGNAAACAHGRQNFIEQQFGRNPVGFVPI